MMARMTDSTIHSGGCLCGRVRYEVRGPLGALYFCHCRQCRKAQGSAFAANVPVASDTFRLVAGADALRSYCATPNKARCFCGECGSPIYSRVNGRDTLRLRAGTLDEPVDLRPAAHIFSAERAAWHLIGDDLPQHRGFEPRR